MELLERESERAALEALIATGGIAVVTGEAGIGKTALVRSVAESRHALWGACDPLITPRPLGPLWDVARQAGGALATAMEAGSREDVLVAALDQLAAAALLVIEDLHWADDATLDLVALLGRRLERGCMVITTRPEPRVEVQRVLSTLPAVRIAPGALSADAVALLATRAGREAADLHAVTSGNPFFVTEALAAPGHDVPVSVREAVALRVAALSERAQAVVELAAVVPGATELWLFPEPAAAIDECLSSGLLHVEDEALAFRHDLARRAVEESMSPIRRRELDRRVLGALEYAGHDEPARLAHHARRAGDREAIRRLAPAAARAASAARGHRQALEQWEAALAAGGDEEALEGVAIEAYLCGRPERAVEARRALLATHEAAGDALRAGDDLRWLSRLLWWTGRGSEAAEVGDRAIAALEAFPDSRELAMALSGRSQLAMLHERHDEAIALGERAAELARRLGDRETLAHALTNVGTSFLGGRRNEQGRELLTEAFELAVAAGQDDHAARARINLATGTLTRRRDDPRVDGDIEAALAFARSHELDGYIQYALGVRANLRLFRGDWPAAEEDARASLALGEQPGVSLCPALVALGRLSSRRGDPEADETLAEAWRVAVATRELQRLAPVAGARAEHAWLAGTLVAPSPMLETPTGNGDAPLGGPGDVPALTPDMPVVEAVWASYLLAGRRNEPWARAEMAMWLRRAGVDVPAHPDDPEPYACAAAGDWAGAAAAWGRLGFPYESGVARAEAGGDARLDALATFDGLGAARVAAHLRRRLRADGVRRIPRGPRPASRNSPAGLTPRESEVLEQLLTGATNAEIAQALVISPKTVDHHVSAVLSKLGVASRRELKGSDPLGFV